MATTQLLVAQSLDLGVFVMPKASQPADPPATASSNIT